MHLALVRREFEWRPEQAAAVGAMPTQIEPLPALDGENTLLPLP